MSLSFPITVLKSQARRLRREEGIPLSAALNRIAAREGYASWSLLVSKAAAGEPRSGGGELLLVAGRPGEGKTRRAWRMLLDGLQQGRPGWYFELHNLQSGLRAQLAHHGADPDAFTGQHTCIASDAVHAGHIDRMVRGAGHCRPVVVIDYLQELDRCRRHPDIDAQLATLARLARDTGATIIALSQVSRRFDAEARDMPGPEDIRQLNPIDLSVFDRMLFLHGGAERYQDAPPA